MKSNLIVTLLLSIICMSNVAYSQNIDKSQLFCISYDESCIFEELDPVYCVSKQKVIQARSHFIKN